MKKIKTEELIEVLNDLESKYEFSSLHSLFQTAASSEWGQLNNLNWRTIRNRVLQHNIPLRTKAAKLGTNGWGINKMGPKLREIAKEQNVARS